MTTLHRDYETRSAIDLKVHGQYVYFEHPSTDVWLCRYAVDDGEIKCWWPGDPVPEEFHRCAKEEGWLALAHNDSFERNCERYVMGPRYGFPQIPLCRHRCTFVMALAMALPGALEHVGPALNTGFEKDMAGHRLMLSMAKPRKLKKGETGVPDANGHYWRDDRESKTRLGSYCGTDVEAERAADKRLVRLRPSEQRLWELDQRINDRGVPVDANLCRKALAIVQAHANTLDREMAVLTDWEVTACTNLNQLKAFLKARETPTDALDREAIVELLARPEIDPVARKALLLRQEAGKASVAKIDALLNGMSADGRARGLLQFHAANTGRWGGRRFQPQNIRRPEKGFDANGVIEAILTRPTQDAMRLLEACYGAPLDCVSYTLRGMIAAPKGKKIVAADFRNIEGRVIAWLAGEHSKLDAFRAFDDGTGPDLYLVAAAGIYGLPIASLSENSPERQIGKVAELACGFGGGVGAFQTMAHTHGVKVPDAQADEIKKAWREAHPDIVRFWYDLEEAALRAIASPGKTFDCGPIRYRVVGSFLWCQLPSGRALCYPYPRVVRIATPWGEMKDAVTFKAVPNISNMRKIVPDPSNTSKWSRISTYGGSLAENVTQAVARDVLAEAMLRVEAQRYPLILTVHDENVSEVAESFGSAKEYEQIMAEPPAWAGGLPIAASGFESDRYRK